MSYSTDRHKQARTPLASTFHSMTRQDIIDNCAGSGGVYVIMTATRYEVIYACSTMQYADTKAEAIAAANVLAADHTAENPGSRCDIFDYTSNPITEEDKPR
jgi:hypothetical protein